MQRCQPHRQRQAPQLPEYVPPAIQASPGAPQFITYLARATTDDETVGYNTRGPPRPKRIKIVDVSITQLVAGAAHVPKSPQGFWDGWV